MNVQLALQQRQHTINLRILADMRTGYTAESISRRLGVELAYVERVINAKHVAQGMLQKGYSPKVIYANFRDLLSMRACGM